VSGPRILSSWRRLSGAAVLATTLAVVAGSVLTASSKPDATAAVVATRYVSPAGADGGACSRRAPCASFDAAVRASRAGDVIQVAAGAYGDQQILHSPGAGRGRVVLRPARRGARVQVGNLVVLGRHVEVRDMRVGSAKAAAGAHDVTFRGLRMHGLFITSASKVRVIGGDVGPGVNANPEIKAQPGSRVPPRDVLIDGVRFHDWTRTDPSAHVECLHVMTVDGLVVRRSRFANCESFDILFTRYGQAGPPRHVRIEGNRLSCCRSGYYSLLIAGPDGTHWDDFLIARNRADKPFGVRVGSTWRRVRFVGNVAPSLNPLACNLPGVRFMRNRWRHGGGCR
jgi:hypothetical protein